MPNEIDDKNNGANNADAGAGAGAGSDAGDGKKADAGAGQGAAGDETITIKKADYDKVISDRDNYRDGLLGKKADERNLDGKKPEVKVPDPVPATVIDEKKITETATATVSKLLRDSAEKSAKRTFLQKHPEYLDDAQWNAMVSNLTFKGGEVSSEEVLDRMEAAVLEHKRSTGKLDEYLQQERERGIREGRIQGSMGAGHGTGGAGDKNGGKAAGVLSQKGEEMARAMHTDPEKVKKVDASKDNVINVL